MPTVSFVVPCYKLAHYLHECVSSILAQTYKDIEVLILDDCSPDDTPAVAAAFASDSRVRYIRNDVNLGHLRTYNKGIGECRGEYIWLISADDKLRVNDAVQRYLEVLLRHSRVGFLCSRGIGLDSVSKETGDLEYFSHGSKDAVFDGRDFAVRVLSDTAGILTPSVLVRRECYERLGLFPLDMPHQGDMYLWCYWAMHYDVGYISDALVNYRLHESSMMAMLVRHNPEIVLRDEFGVLWHTALAAAQLRLFSTARQLERCIVKRYCGYVLPSICSNRHAIAVMSLADCECSVVHHARSERQRRRIINQVYCRIADECYWQKDSDSAKRFYNLSLKEVPYSAHTLLRRILLSMGRVGEMFRSRRSSVRLSRGA